MRYFFLLLLLALQPVCSIAQKEGKDLIDSLQQTLAGGKEDTNKVKILNRIASMYWSYDPNEGINYGRQALTLAEKLEWKYGMGAAWVAIGVNSRYRSDYKRTFECYTEAIKIFESIDHKEGLAKVYGNMCIVLIDQGDYSMALDYGFKALKTGEALNNPRLIASCLSNIGIIYDDQAQYDEALRYHFKALEVSKQLKYGTGIAICLSNIGLIYQKQEQFDKALEYNLQADSICLSLGDKNARSPILSYIGLAYVGLKNYAKALEYFSIGLESDKITENKAGIAEKLASMGKAYLAYARDNGSAKPRIKPIAASKEQSLKKSIEYLSDAAAIHQAIGNIKELSDDYLNLSGAWAQLGNDREALETYKLYTINKDSVFSIKSNIKIANLEAKRELDLKDKQIALYELAMDKKRNERSFFIAGIILLAVIGIISINWQRTKQKKLEVEKGKAEAELEAATAKLIIFSRDALEKDEAVEHPKKAEPVYADPEVLAQLEHAILLTDEQWDDFRRLFEKVHTGFFSRLREQMPELTPGEVRFLALTKLKLSAKEMASILGISPGTIRSYRMRIRRKFGFNDEKNIEEIVDSI
ncbi:MAG: photosystem assembly protein Ycf3 [Flavipsychrobacter sp.]|nr:photosystem assembly protein Ycf3 [Flavipsychrobacter sp.]